MSEETEYLVTYTDKVTAKSEEEAMQEAAAVIIAEDNTEFLVANMVAYRLPKATLEEPAKPPNYSWNFTPERLEEIRTDPRGSMPAKQEIMRLVDHFIESENKLEKQRHLIHDLETNCDPAGNLQEIGSLKEQVGGLLAMLKKPNNGLLSLEEATSPIPSTTDDPFDYSDWHLVLSKVQNTDHAKGKIEHALLYLTDDQRRSLFRAVASLSRTIEPIPPAALQVGEEGKLPELDVRDEEAALAYQAMRLIYDAGMGDLAVYIPMLHQKLETSYGVLHCRERQLLSAIQQRDAALKENAHLKANVAEWQNSNLASWWDYHPRPANFDMNGYALSLEHRVRWLEMGVSCNIEDRKGFRERAEQAEAALVLRDEEIARLKQLGLLEGPND